MEIGGIGTKASLALFWQNVFNSGHYILPATHTNFARTNMCVYMSVTMVVNMGVQCSLYSVHPDFETYFSGF